MNNYFRDLSCRQNQPITQAEIHLFKNAKRYYDKEIRECSNIMKEKEHSTKNKALIKDTPQKNDVKKSIKQKKERKQLDLHGKITEAQRNRRLTELELKLENLKSELENKTEELENLKNLNFKDIEKGNKLEEKFIKKFEEKFFVYQRKLIIMEDEKNVLKMKYKIDLFDELIQEFGKLYEWLDSRVTHLKFNDDKNNEYIIEKEEIKIVIDFFRKINRIEKDN